MAKIRIYDLAKELGKQNNDILNLLREKGIDGKTPSSSVEEEVASMVRKNFDAAGGKQSPEKAPGAKTANAERTGGENVKAQAVGGEAPKTEAPKAQTPRPEAPKSGNASPQGGRRDEKGKPGANRGEGEDAHKKKKNIIFVSNPQNSKMSGQRQGGGQNQNRQGGGQNRGGQNQNGGQGRSGRPQSTGRLIRPLTPPSPTPSVQMVPENRGGQPKRPRQNEGAVQNQNQAQAQIQSQSQNQSRQEPAAQDQSRQNRPQGGFGQGGRPVRDGRPQNEGRGERTENRDNRGGGSRPQGQGGRPQGQGGRPQNRPFQGRGGADGGRPQGDRQGGGFQRPARPGQEGGQNDRRGGNGSAAPGRGYNNNGRDNRAAGGQGNQFRGGRDDRAGKSFSGEAGGKDMEKKREEDKRRFSQEKDKRSKKDHIYEEDEAVKNKPGRFIKPEKKKESEAEEAIKVIILPESVTIKELAEKMKMPPAAIIKKLFLEGKIVTVNQEISYEDAESIAMEYDILCEREVKVDVIEELLKEDDENEEDMVERPPVICVMGHVDHGKTSLLDAIRKTNVTDKEAGGITQHIGAYTVTINNRKITFLDTPGHEAFTAMRMRGANATDIAILVVAADDGVMPQTIEAINHAKAAGIEIIVAVNKIDKPSANIDRVKQELAEYELIPEDWGGSTIFAPVSAKSGEGIEQLLEMILLTADIQELKANPNRRARGLVIEAELDKGRGPVATILVQKGTLRVGDFVSAGACHGKVRAMIDDKGRRVKEATPSTPVEILGLSDVPSAGEVFLAHESDKTARNYAETYLAQNKEKKLEETKGKMSLDDLFSQIKEGNLKELDLIVKADVQGSVEAVKQSLLKLSNEEIVVKCIHGGVGAITESDVSLASASNAIIIGFNVRPDATAKATAEREGVDVRLYKVIYQAIEDVEAAMKGMLDPVFEEKVIGHAEVRQLFRASAIGNIAGSYVLDGEFRRGCKVRITREGEQIFEGGLASLKRFKDDVKEVRSGYECGLVFEGFDQMQELDIVEAYIMVEVPR